MESGHPAECQLCGWPRWRGVASGSYRAVLGYRSSTCATCSSTHKRPPTDRRASCKSITQQPLIPSTLSSNRCLRRSRSPLLARLDKMASHDDDASVDDGERIAHQTTVIPPDQIGGNTRFYEHEFPSMDECVVVNVRAIAGETACCSTAPRKFAAPASGTSSALHDCCVHSARTCTVTDRAAGAHGAAALPRVSQRAAVDTAAAEWPKQLCRATLPPVVKALATSSDAATCGGSSVLLFPHGVAARHPWMGCFNRERQSSYETEQR
jgi:hypothetical protein